MNLSEQQGADRKAGAVGFGGHNNAAPADFQVGAVGFGPGWTMEDSMAASIVRLEQENDELRATNAVAEQERAILVREMERLREQIADYRNTIEALRDQICQDKCRDKSQADGGWGNI
jgi:cell division protein FtsB